MTRLVFQNRNMFLKGLNRLCKKPIRVTSGLRPHVTNRGIWHLPHVFGPLEVLQRQLRKPD